MSIEIIQKKVEISLQIAPNVPFLRAKTKKIPNTSAQFFFKKISEIFRYFPGKSSVVMGFKLQVPLCELPIHPRFKFHGGKLEDDPFGFRFWEGGR